MNCEFPLHKAFHFIEPGPVILLVTSDNGKPNAMTLSWSVLIDFDPIIGCVLSSGDYSYEILKRTKECVIAIPAVDIMEKTVQIGNCSGEDMDKFKTFGLTPIKSQNIKPPLIKEALANIECKVIDVSLADSYGLFIMKGIKAWIDNDKADKRTFHAVGDGTFVIDGERRDLKRLMTKWPQFI
ncbi:MAG: flavin reductase family protein [Campylobacteraceae bacterium]|jgi:flavin reductase (DIM6/NTAB) family NADH-FMN oxidoreductase RutF|nr:flavin reductase family protein [Campylobacteraceae bacterium]